MPVDIFATKAIEYVLILGFLAVLLTFGTLLAMWGRRERTPDHGPRQWFHIPGEVFFHPGHTWARLDGDGLVRIGMDDFAQKLVGVPTRVELPDPGQQLGQGEPGWQLAVDSKAVELLSPVDGEVVSLNPAVLENPGLVNQDPYGDGWLMKVKPSQNRIQGLIHGPHARAWMDATEESLRRFVSPEVGTVLQDGGAPVTGIASSLSEDGWDDIARQFLNPK